MKCLEWSVGLDCKNSLWRVITPETRSPTCQSTLNLNGPPQPLSCCHPINNNNGDDVNLPGVKKNFLCGCRFDYWHVSAALYCRANVDSLLYSSLHLFPSLFLRFVSRWQHLLPLLLFYSHNVFQSIILLFPSALFPIEKNILSFLLEWGWNDLYLEKNTFRTQ